MNLRYNKVFFPLSLFLYSGILYWKDMFFLEFYLSIWSRCEQNSLFSIIEGEQWHFLTEANLPIQINSMNVISDLDWIPCYLNLRFVFILRTNQTTFPLPCIPDLTPQWWCLKGVVDSIFYFVRNAFTFLFQKTLQKLDPILNRKLSSIKLLTFCCAYFKYVLASPTLIINANAKELNKKKCVHVSTFNFHSIYLLFN